MKRALVLIACWFLGSGIAQAIPNFTTQSIQGVNVQVPKGWISKSDEYSIQLLADPNNEDAPFMGMMAATISAGVSVTPRQLAEQMIIGIQQESQDIAIQLVGERESPQALYQLHQIVENEEVAYLSSFSFFDRSSGAIVYIFFAALEEEFASLGGPALPLVAFGGMAPSSVQTIQQQAQTSVSIPTDLASQISAMSHETTMKILYNMDSGWCYQGESGCR